jgi:hypothetical protein
LIIGTVDFGCDRPNVLADAPPATPRRAVENNGFRTPQAGVLLYGRLPSGATTVELILDDGRSSMPTSQAVDVSSRSWAVPITPGDNPQSVVYRLPDGSEVARYAIP